MTDQPDDSLPQWTEDELALLRSADRDRPPSRSLPATLAAVGLGSAIVTSAAGAHGAAITGAAGVATASAKWSGIVALSKWVAVAALGGTVVAGGVVLSRRSETVKPPAVQAPRRLTTSPEPVARPTLAAPDEAAPMQAVPDEAASAPASARPAKKRPPSHPDIRFEIDALDAARITLRAGNAAEALAALDRYDAKYARAGALAVEATALRIEALVLSGQRAKAVALAATFLSSHPRSPYAGRIRALTDSASSQPQIPH